MRKKALNNESAASILAAATRLFRKYGYYAVSMADIQSASNTTRGNLYYYFPGGKEELVEYVIQNARQSTSEKLERFFSPGTEPVRNITDYFLSMAEEVDRQDCNVSLHLLLMETSEINARLEAISVDTIRHLDRYFYSEVAKCGFDPVKTCQVASVILSMLLGAVNNCLVKRDSTALRSLIPQIPLIFTANGYLAGENKKKAD